MTFVLIWLSVASQQLTWYELYERGEKHFLNGAFAECISDMNAALAIKPNPERTAFTRAVQKIEYKPYYYKALAHFKNNEIQQAFQSLQRAYEGEVVSQSPKLQADLARILDSYRIYVQDMHLRYTREEATIRERKRLLSLLAEGRLNEVTRDLESAADSEEFDDIRMYVSLQEDYQYRLGLLRSDALKRIEDWLDQGEGERAQALFESIRESLPNDTIRLLKQRFETLPEPEEPDASEAVVETEPETDYVKEIDFFKESLRSMEAQKNKLDRRVAQMEAQNRELQNRIQEKRVEPAPFLPKILLVLKRAGLLRMAIEAHAVSPLKVQRWVLSLDGKALALPESALKTDGSDFYLNHQVTVPDFGEYEVAFTLTDELGSKATTQDRLVITRPFYLKRVNWLIFALMLVLLSALAATMRYHRRRQARLRHFNPYIAGSPVRGTTMFYGRDELLHRIQGLVHKNSFMIYGDRRIGKTSLLWQLKRNLAEDESQTHRFYPVFIDLQGANEQDLFHHIMAEILPQTADWNVDADDLSFGEGEDAYKSRHFSRDIKKLIHRLQASEQRHVVVVLLMDEVDVLNEFGEKTNQKLRGIFMKDFAEHLTCVMAGIHLKKEWESSGSPWYNFFEEIPMEPFGARSARALILEPVKGIFKYRKSAVDLIVGRTGGHPYLIQKVCVWLIGEKLKSNRFLITAADVRSAFEKINEDWVRNGAS